jgi:hypothetical protein
MSEAWLVLFRDSRSSSIAARWVLFSHSECGSYYTWYGVCDANILQVLRYPAFEICKTGHGRMRKFGHNSRCLALSIGCQAYKKTFNQVKAAVCSCFGTHGGQSRWSVWALSLRRWSTVHQIAQHSSTSRKAQQLMQLSSEWRAAANHWQWEWEYWDAKFEEHIIIKSSSGT